MKLHLIVMLLATLNLSSARADGGVSDGGGGTTNPNPTHPARIERVLRDYSPLLLNAIQTLESNFLLMPETERPPIWKKLFQGPKTLHNLVRETTAEIRYNAPCLDAKGAPHDGSIYASKPGAICLSAQRMAPKLNDWNVMAETFALHVHELSHLLGADEKEAESIQASMIALLMRTDPISHIVDLGLLIGNHSNLNIARRDLRQTLARPELLLTSWGLRSLQGYIDGVQSQITQVFRVELTPRYYTKGVYLMQFLMSYATDSICFLEAKDDESLPDCKFRISTYFGPANELTIEQYYERAMGFPANDEHPLYASLLAYPKDLNSVALSMKTLVDFLDGLHATIESTSKFQVTIEAVH